MKTINNKENLECVIVLTDKDRHVYDVRNTEILATVVLTEKGFQVFSLTDKESLKLWLKNLIKEL